MTAILAIGQTFVIITAGIDLSVGAVVGFTTVIEQYLLVQGGKGASSLGNPRRRSPGAVDGGRGRRSRRRRRRVHADPAPTRRRGRGAGPGAPGDRGAGRRGAGVDRHPQARGGPGRGRGRRHARSTTSRRSLAAVAAELGVGWVAMHMQGDPAHHAGRAPRYDDVVAEVHDFLAERADARRARPASTRSGSTPASASARPPSTTCACCATSTSSSRSGYPVLVGTSRKGFLGRAARRAPTGVGTSPAPTDDRLEGSLATATWAMAQGAAWSASTTCGPPCRPPSGRSTGGSSRSRTTAERRRPGTHVEHEPWQ